MDPKRDLKIKLLRKRGKTYEEIAKALHVGRSTISKVLGMESTESRTGWSRTATTAFSFGGESSYIEGSAPIKGGNIFGNAESGAPGSTESNTFINKKRTKLMADREGLRIVSIENPGRSSKLSHKNILSPLGKLVLFLAGIMLFIWVLKKFKREEESIS